MQSCKPFSLRSRRRCVRSMPPRLSFDRRKAPTGGASSRLWSTSSSPTPRRRALFKGVSTKAHLPNRRQRSENRAFSSMQSLILGYFPGGRQAPSIVITPPATTHPLSGSELTLAATQYLTSVDEISREAEKNSSARADAPHMLCLGPSTRTSGACFN